MCKPTLFFRLYFSLLAVLVQVPSLFAYEEHSSWSFGVLADTQWKESAAPFHGTAIHVIDAINAEFIRQDVDFVIQVGDLVNRASDIAYQTRIAHNESLAEAGIAFYPLRGNHDVHKTEFEKPFSRAFPNLPHARPFLSAACRLPPVASVPHGLTYSFTHKGGKFILLDTFPTDRCRQPSVACLLPWMEAELENKDYRFALVFAHKNLRGQYHKNNIFGKNHDSQLDTQNAFIGLLHRHGVKYFLSGHDHMYHRSQITSPDEKAEIGQIICGHASHKSYKPTPTLFLHRETFLGTFYIPALPFLSREETLFRESNRVGFLIVRVESERIRFEYYSAEPFGSKPKQPVWEIRDSFEYEI